MNISRCRSRNGARHHNRASLGADNCIHIRSHSLQSIPEDGWSDSEDIFPPNRTNFPSAAALSTTPSINLCTRGIFKPQNFHPMTSVESATRIELVELIGYERAACDLHSYEISSELNQLATEQAQIMAGVGFVFHTVATIGELKFHLSSRQVAENVQRGDNPSQMHAETMGEHHGLPISAINRSNLLSPYFTEFGCGVAMGKDGKIYCCQLFRS